MGDYLHDKLLLFQLILQFELLLINVASLELDQMTVKSLEIYPLSFDLNEHLILWVH